LVMATKRVMARKTAMVINNNNHDNNDDRSNGNNHNNDSDKEDNDNDNVDRVSTHKNAIFSNCLWTNSE
jgi:hypothetical protein